MGYTAFAFLWSDRTMLSLAPSISNAHGMGMEPHHSVNERSSFYTLLPPSPDLLHTSKVFYLTLGQLKLKTNSAEYFQIHYVYNFS